MFLDCGEQAYRFEEYIFKTAPKHAKGVHCSTSDGQVVAGIVFLWVLSFFL